MQDFGNSDPSLDTSGACDYRIRFIQERALRNVASALHEIRVAVADFTASVDSYIRNQDVIRGIKYTRAPGGNYLPTYDLRTAFQFRPHLPSVRCRLRLDRVPPRRTSRSLCPRARSTRRTRTTRGVITRLRWKSPGKR